MLFSLIVPFYNVEKYIRKCLGSIDAQTCRDFEVILVDDGSKDATVQIVEEFINGREAQYNLIRQNNRGLSGARNTALKYATGEYLVFIDSDDWIETNYLSCIESVIKGFSPDIIRCKWFENSDSEMVNFDICGETRRLEKQSVLENLLMDCYGSQVWKNVYRSILWRAIDFPEGFLYEDLYTTHRVFAKAQSIYFLDRPFYHYVIHPDSISTAPKFGRAKGIYFGFKNRFDWVSRYEIYGDIKPELFSKMWDHLLQYIHECLKFHKDTQSVKKECWEIFMAARRNNYKISLSKRMELLLFLKMNSTYQKLFHLIRR